MWVFLLMKNSMPLLPPLPLTLLLHQHLFGHTKGSVSYTADTRASVNTSIEKVVNTMRAPTNAISIMNTTTGQETAFSQVVTNTGRVEKLFMA